MKTFKKVISLVLVFAMLASFAGMTGFTAQAAFLELQATTNMLEFNAGGFTVKMPTVLYKSKSDGTEDYYGDTGAVKDDYVILPAHNPNMNFSITPPSSGVAKWEPQVSINGSAYSGWWGGQTHTNTISRGNAWKEDYSYFLYDIHNQWGQLKGKGGYYSVPQIRWRIAYIPSGSSSTTYTHFTDEWIVNLQFWSDKPFDTKSGINAATIDAPTILYKGSDGNVASTAGTTTLDTIFDIWVPSNTNYSSITAVTENDTDIIGINTADNPDMIKDLGTDSTGKKHIQINFAGWSVNGMTEEGKRDRIYLRFDYTVPDVTNIPYNYHSNNILDTKNSADELLPNKSSPYLESKYGDYGDKTVPDTVDVTYTQYMAVYVKDLPVYKIAENTVSYRYNSATINKNNNRIVFAFYQNINFASFLKQPGISLVSQYGGTGDGYVSYYNGGTTVPPAALTSYSPTSNVANGTMKYFDQYTLYAHHKTDGEDTHKYIYNVVGYDEMSADSYNSHNANTMVGMKFYVDKAYVDADTTNLNFPSTLTASFYSEQPVVNDSDYSFHNKGNIKRPKIYTENDDYTTFGIFPGYSIGGEWKRNLGNGSVTTHENIALGDNTYANYAWNGFDNNQTSGNKTVNLTFNKAFLSSNQTALLICIVQGTTDDFSVGVGQTKNRDVRHTLSYHFETQVVDRDTEHAVINAAISKNYVKAEMDSNWWANYRSEVFNAYILCGDLTNATGKKSTFDTQMADGKGTDSPAFVTADFSALEAAILKAPEYDRGTSQRDVNITGKAPVGSKFYDVVKYNDGEAQAVDPANGATYYNNDTAGNGVTNIDNASLYRYSGAYFYTEATWKTYAIERYYALNIRKFPSSSVDAWWYGAGYMPGGFDNSLCKTYIQSQIDAATTRLTNAFNALELKKLDEFKMRDDRNPQEDYTGDGVADQVTAGGGKWVYFDKDIKDADGNIIYKKGEQIIGYDAIMAYLKSLIPTETVTYYTAISDANGNGRIDTLDTDNDGYIDDLNPATAPVYNTGDLEALLSTMQNTFYADDTVVSMGLDFEKAIENFLAQVEIIKRTPNTTNSSIWDKIFAQMRTNLGDSDMEIGGLVGALKNEYNLTDTDAVITNINSAITQFANFNLESNADVGQETFNTIAETFYTALNNEVTAKKIDTAATEALKATEGKFTVYNPFNLAGFDEHLLYEWHANQTGTEAVKDGRAYVGKYTQDSIDDLNDAITAAKNKGYNMLTTSVADNIVADADKLLAQAGVKTVTGVTPVLVNSKANFTVLKETVAEAEALIADSRITVTNFNGATAPHNKYTANSLAELVAVVNMANTYISENAVTAVTVDEKTEYVGKSDCSTQLEVDKLVFQIQDEMYNSRRLSGSTHFSISEDPDTGLITQIPMQHYSWTYTTADDGTVTAAPTAINTDFYDTNKWAAMLNDNEIKQLGNDNGLVSNTAYFGFLEEELKTPYLTEEDLRVDPDNSVWNEYGWLVLDPTTNKAPADVSLFSGTWGAYAAAYNEALDLYNAQTVTVDNQKTIDDAALKLYNARLALELAKPKYFPDGSNWEAAKTLFAEFSAYAQTTDITRYGYKWVEVEQEDGTKVNELQPSDNPIDDPVNQAVYIYEGVTDEIVAKIVDYQARFVDKNSTEPAESTAYIKLHEDIMAALKDENGNPYGLKPADHADFVAGLNDLKTNYIAGNWDGTTYTSNVLSQTQIDALQDLLETAQSIINTGEVTADYGANIASSATAGGGTNFVFNYTKNVAKDLQFAVAMRKQVEDFLTMTYDVAAIEFYNGGKSISEDNTHYVFNQNTVKPFLTKIKTLFETEANWPCIYEINDLVVSKNDEDVYSVTTYTDNADVDAKIDKFFAADGGVGANSAYYTNAIAATNEYNTDALKWIYQNALYEDDLGNVYVLADLQPGTDGSATTSAAGVPINYDMLTTSGGWYSDGYGTTINNRSYYLIYGADEDNNTSSWFSNYAEQVYNPDERVFEDEEGNTISCPDYVSYIFYTDFYDYLGVDAHEDNPTTAGLMASKLEIPFKIAQNYGGLDWENSSEYDDEGYPLDRIKNSKYYADLIRTNGWTKSSVDGLANVIAIEQGQIDDTVNNYYAYIRALKLLKAVAAYREVEELYLWAFKGQTVTAWQTPDANNQYPFQPVPNTGTVAATNNIFFNPAFVDRITTNNCTGPFEDDYTGKYPYYYTNSGYKLEDKYDDQAAAYTNVVDFITKFHAEQENNGAAMITIDKAALVSGVDNDDKVESKMEELIVLLSQLKLKDYNFEDLNALVSAFYSIGGSADAMNAFFSNEFADEYGLKYPLKPGTQDRISQYYAGIENYTSDSRNAVINFLKAKGVVKSSFNTSNSLNVNFIQSDSGDWFYTNPQYNDNNENSYTGEDAILAITKDLAALISSLVLAPADTKGLDSVIETGLNYVNHMQDLIVTTNEDGTVNAKWKAFIDILYGGEGYDTTNIKADKTVALYVQKMSDPNNTDTYFTRALDQETVVNAVIDSLTVAIANLEWKKDDTAPTVTLMTDKKDVDNFYGSTLVDDGETNASRLAGVDAVSFTGEEATPATGAFFMPGSGKDAYSIMVYTNELNPRLVFEIEDIKNIVAASKHEQLNVYAKKTAGVVPNLIYGTRDADDKIVDIQKADVSAKGADNNYVFQGYTNLKPTESVEDNGVQRGSSVFAILAPTFNAGSNDVQMAQYFISVCDNVEDAADNYATSVDMGDGIYSTIYNEQIISIYVYYNNVMGENGNEEGINADGTKADPAEAGGEVASVMLSGEPGYKGAWRNGVMLTRSFSKYHRIWEFVPVINNAASDMANIPVYNDPTFNQLNTGSFYYVLDESVATDKAIIDAYTNTKTDGTMNYAAATVAKDAMIKAINDSIVDGKSTVFEAMKSSKRLYEYGDYYRDETTGEVLYDEKNEVKWINWAQPLNSKVDNGDFVFIHVVDRWGNVINRMVEITQLDEIAPAVTKANAGYLEIEESGGSGIKNIDIWNGFSFEEKVTSEYEIVDSTTQLKITGTSGVANHIVKCSGNVLTVSGLVAGGTYYIDIYDNAGNVSYKTMKASSGGSIEFEVIDEDNNVGNNGSNVETGEENAVTQSVSFTLNGTDTVILNAGQASSVINAEVEGNVFADRMIVHYVTTLDTVTQLKTVDDNGKVEEWTTSTAMVADNGDGTLTWQIMRQLTEGEHNYKVYAMVNGEYEDFFAPATLNATSRYVTVTYMAVGMGAVTLKHSGLSTLMIKPNTFGSAVVPYGAKVSIVAASSTEGCEFHYWVNNSTDRIVSTADNYEFRAVTDINCAAQFTSTATHYDGKKLVVYVNNAKNVISTFQLEEGESYAVPAGPVLPDYSFKGWSMTKEEVLASDKNTVIVEPVYVLAAKNTVTITEGNYTATGAGTYVADENQRAVATISAAANDNDGNAFLYWLDADTNEIVSYERTYSFFCVKDTVLTPVYGDASTVVPQPIIRITEVRYSALSGKVSFFAERSVPEEFTLLQTGIVVTKTESIGTNEDVFVVGGTSTATGTSTSTANNGYYSASAAIYTGQTVWARAYAIYETADGEILETYGPVASYTVD